MCGEVTSRDHHVGGGSGSPESASLFGLRGGDHSPIAGTRAYVFRVDDVDALLAELNRRGVPTFVELGSYPGPGVRLCLVKDNNGNLIEFVTPLKESAQ